MTGIDRYRCEISRALAKTPGIKFYSLQKGEGAKQTNDLSELIDRTEELNNFADTAAY